MSDSSSHFQEQLLLTEVAATRAVVDPWQEKLETLYSSNRPGDVMTFYSTLRDIHDLVNFSSHRPHPEIRIYGYRIKRDPGLVIVTSTRDRNGPLARSLVSAYREFPVIVVESRGQFFNFAYAMNLGIRAAIDLDPRQILVTNDDAYPTEYARAKLASLDQYGSSVLVPDVSSTRPHHVGRRFSIREQPPPLRIAYKTLGGGLANLLPMTSRAQAWASRLLADDSGDLAHFFLLSTDKYASGSARSLFEGLLRLISREAIQVLNTQPVAVFPSRVIESRSFDDLFINGGEDLDLALQLKLGEIDSRELPLQFCTDGGASLGTGMLRVLRHSVFEALYLGYKLRRVYHLL